MQTIPANTRDQDFSFFVERARDRIREYEENKRKPVFSSRPDMLEYFDDMIESTQRDIAKMEAAWKAAH